MGIKGLKGKWKICILRWVDSTIYIAFALSIYFLFNVVDTVVSSSNLINDFEFFKLAKEFMKDGERRYYYLSFILLVLFTYDFTNTKKSLESFFLRLVNNIVFPSIKLIIFIGVFIITLFSSGFSFPVRLILIFISVGVVSLFFHLIIIWIYLKIKKSSAETSYDCVEDKNILEVSDEEFVKWIENEDGFSCDYFETEKTYRNQIETFLKAEKSLLLFGEYGIGKSWILRKIEKKFDERFHFCFVDCWGREASSLPEQILSKVIFDLSEYIDTTHMNCIPQKYKNALSKAGFFESLLKIDSDDYDPSKIIQRLDETLEIIGKKVVIIVEDVDRNSNLKGALSQVEPLFDRLKSTKNINFILTLSHSEVVENELNRVVDNKITMIVQERSRLKVIGRFREILIKAYREKQLIDPYTEMERSEQKIEFNFDAYFFESFPVNTTKKEKNGAESVEYNENHAYRYLIELIDTPRKIRKYFYEAIKKWDMLVGEIDLDSFLFLIAIRQANFNSYEFFFKNSFFTLGLGLGQKNKEIDEFKKYIDVNEKNNRSMSVDQWIVALVWTILNREQGDKIRQKIISKRECLQQLENLEIITDDKKSLQDINEYLNDKSKNLPAKFIIKRHLIGRFIYLDKVNKNGEVFAHKMSELMLENYSRIVLDLANLHLDGNSFQESFIKELVKKACENNSEIEDDFKKIIKDLFVIINEKENGLFFTNRLILEISKYSKNVPSIYLSFLKEKIENNIEILERLVKMDLESEIYELVFTFPTYGMNRSDDEEPFLFFKGYNICRKKVGFILDGVVSLIKDSSNPIFEKALKVLFNFILRNLPYTTKALDDRATGITHPTQVLVNIIGHLYPNDNKFVREAIFNKENSKAAQEVINIVRISNPDSKELLDEVSKILKN